MRADEECFAHWNASGVEHILKGIKLKAYVLPSPIRCRRSPRDHTDFLEDVEVASQKIGWNIEKISEFARREVTGPECIDHRKAYRFAERCEDCGSVSEIGNRRRRFLEGQHPRTVRWGDDSLN